MVITCQPSRRRPVVDAAERVAHQPGAVGTGKTGRDAEGVDALFISEEGDGAGPVGAPEAAVEAESVEDAAERVPDVGVGKLLVRQRAGAADLDDDVVVP